jgi:hypothetical protein
MEFYVHLLVKKNATSLIPEQKPTSQRKNLQRPTDYLPVNRCPTNRCPGASDAWPLVDRSLQCSIGMRPERSFTARVPRPH